MRAVTTWRRRLVRVAAPVLVTALGLVALGIAASSGRELAVGEAAVTVTRSGHAAAPKAEAVSGSPQVDLLPDGFPEQVPVADGEFVTSSTTSGTWSAMVRLPGDAAAVPDVARDALAALTDAGFEVRTSSRIGAVVSTVLADDDHTVALTVTADARGVVVAYTVIAR